MSANTLSSRMDRLMRAWRAADENHNRTRQNAISRQYHRLDAQLRDTWDYVTVWTLTIDGDYGVSTQAFLTEEAAVAELRKYAIDNCTEDAVDMSDEALIDYLCEEAGVVHYLDEHKLLKSTGAAS